jgi:FMN phosphatase YigB (HAD superfamily)
MKNVKLLFENWRGYLKENEAAPAIVTFDFDDTLSLSHWGEEEDDYVHDGPHQEMVDLLMDYNRKGTKIFIVTSRYKEMQDEERKWFRHFPNMTPPRKYFKEYQMPVWEFVKKHGLPVQDVIFTNGDLKTKAEDGLIEIGSDIHHDDDMEEIEAAEAAGIKTIVSDPYTQKKEE